MPIESMEDLYNDPMMIEIAAMVGMTPREMMSVPFKGEPFYNEVGDCIEYRESEESYYGKWIDHNLTLYVSDETDKPMGFQIFGVQEMTTEKAVELLKKFKEGNLEIKI